MYEEVLLLAFQRGMIRLEERSEWTLEWPEQAEQKGVPAVSQWDIPHCLLMLRDLGILRDNDNRTMTRHKLSSGCGRSSSGLPQSITSIYVLLLTP